MKRREFITLLGGATVAWPLAARAQQSAMPVIGFLASTSPTAWAPYLTAFKQGLREAGYIEGQNVTIEYRWAEGDYARLPALAADLVRRHVAVLVAVGGSSSAKAAKAASSTIPIVFTTGGDPVGLGLVASLNRPGGNVTGVALLISEMESKRFGLLRDMVPTATLVAVLLNSRSPVSTTELNDVQEAARAVGQQIHILNASSEQELDAAFASLAKLGAGALLVGSDPFFNSRRSYLVSLAARARVPAIYELREYVVAGGLMSYGTSLVNGYRQVGLYTGRILKGEKPQDLPVVQSTKFEFVINLKTAKALGLEVPLRLQELADEVIE
jgi:putative tryptophan/tyrosine transport system substrate-binding protein